MAPKIATGTILVTGTAVTEATAMEATEVTNTSRLRQLRVGRYSPNTRRLCSSRISSAMLVRDRRTSIPCGFSATCVAKPPRSRRLGFLPRGIP